MERRQGRSQRKRRIEDDDEDEDDWEGHIFNRARYRARSSTFSGDR